MLRWLMGLLALASTPVLAQAPAPQPPAEQVPQIPYELVRDFLKLPADIHLGEAAGVAVNSKGHVFVFSRGGSSQGPAFANTAAQLYEFGAGRQVHPRDRQESLRLVVRPHGAHRPRRQHLGDRQGLGHDRQVQPAGPGHDGVRAQAGGLRPRRQAL